MILSCNLISRNIAFVSTNYQNYSRCFSILRNKLRERNCHFRKLNNQMRAASQMIKAAHIFNSSDVPLSNKTIGQLLDDATAKWPERVCIISNDQNISLTFFDLCRRVDALAAGLKKLGLKKGDRLGIWSPNHVEWIIASLSASRIGLISVTINPAYQQSELEYCLQKVSIKAIVSPPLFKTQNYLKMLLAAKAVCPNLEHIIIYSQDHITGTRRLVDVENLATKAEVSAIAAEQNEFSNEDDCNIQFTSGSTGRPKGTVLSHKSIVNNSKQVSRRSKVTPEDKMCLNVPLFHIYGLLMGQMNMLNTGCAIVLESSSFNPTKSIEILTREKCTLMCGTPTMWVNIIEKQKQLQLPISSLRCGLIGGAPVAPEIFKQIRNVLGLDNIMSLYGLTEAAGIIFQSRFNDDHQLVQNSVGCLLEHVEAMVINKDGLPVSYGIPGELWVRGYCVMKCYWDEEVNMRNTLTQDGWLKTGDQFILYENGYGNIVGRFKDIIIRGGENIFPKEIEDFLMTHPKIQEVQIIGAYDAVLGEAICACVQLCNGEAMTEEELKAYCKGKIAHFKIPHYVAFVDSYPKTASGKIQKFRLKEEMERKGIIPIK